MLWKNLSRIENVYTPQEWYHHVKDSAVTATSRVEVIDLQEDCFRNHRDYLRQLYTERNKADAGRLLEFSKVMWLNFGTEEGIVDGDRARASQ